MPNLTSELALIRGELDALVVLRSLGGFTLEEWTRYYALTDREVELLRAERSRIAPAAI